MRLVYVGGFWDGSTALQRLRAFQQIPGVRATALDTGDRCEEATLIDRVAHRLRRPVDWNHVNREVLAVAATRPDVLFFDNIKIMRPATLWRVRDELGVRPVFYTPDNVIAPHNSSRQLEASWKAWSIVFTTKSFNEPDFNARRVERTHVMGNAFDPELHRPMTPEEVGSDFEHFDVAFAGVAERPRRDAINRLASTGLSAVVFGEPAAWGDMHPNVMLKPPVWNLDYSRAMHTAKVSLCFLRKINHDTVTTRSLELPAMARPMAAERTDEHDALFDHGVEYLGFSSEDELVSSVRPLIEDESRRRAMGAAARQRCLVGRYSTIDRAAEMIEVMKTVLPNG